MSSDALQERVSGAMRANLSLVAQMHFARLEQLFPRAILDVQIGYDPELRVKTIRVAFRNGHVAEGPETEAKSDVFTARCVMLHDLPPL